MSIPLYFVTNCNESVPFTGSVPIHYSCGVTSTGELRLPKAPQSSVPLLFDDSYTVMPTENCLKKLRSLCQNGCILDFERPTGDFHKYILQRLKEWKIELLWLPERLASYSSSAFITVSQSLPHNSFRQFCRSLQQRYPNRWCLELQPVNWEKRLNFPQKEREFYVEEAACMCRIRGNTVHYYDTKQSLTKKLRIAEECGCRGAVALWSEWENK